MALCFCCQEPYNKSTRSLVRCDQYKSGGAGVKECGFETCRTCVRRYLLGHTCAGPHCMNCKKSWGRTFLLANLTRSWLENIYSKTAKQ